jgi:hypothetical protein
LIFHVTIRWLHGETSLFFCRDPLYGIFMVIQLYKYIYSY